MMKNIARQVKIYPKFSAGEWQLNTASRDCKPAADALNKALRLAVNTDGSTKDTAQEYMMSIMRQFAEYGAYDSEPIWFLRDVLTQVYKRP
jgi:hypothetical protein